MVSDRMVGVPNGKRLTHEPGFDIIVKYRSTLMRLCSIPLHCKLKYCKNPKNLHVNRLTNSISMP
jgi:hypothetical protein